ncbi:hypothetical protein Bca52824_022720 [Brassica carinata]|uniref:NYN domain-containing protein n=1 Tax=Brassica carinata TaxID=52824 RepID=A0A8X7VGH9_BRACI|nr:hypothetical protein Bca52824_022720 [Brassica carinata]
MPFPQSINLMLTDESFRDPRFTEMKSDTHVPFVHVPSPPDIYGNAKTSVFWDIADYPIPIGKDPVSFCHRMKLALFDRGYKGELSIYVYFVTGELVPKSLETCVGVGVDFLPKG